MQIDPKHLEGDFELVYELEKEIDIHALLGRRLFLSLSKIKPVFLSSRFVDWSDYSIFLENVETLDFSEYEKLGITSIQYHWDESDGNIELFVLIKPETTPLDIRAFTNTIINNLTQERVDE